MIVQAQLKWTDGLQFVGRAGDGPAVVIDTHDSGSGPSPMELILMGVAGCTAIDIVIIMDRTIANAIIIFFMPTSELDAAKDRHGF